MKEFNQDKLNEIIRKVTMKKHIHGAVYNVSTGDESQSWCGASGNLKVDSRYYIASINKMIISSLVLKLIADGRLSFDDSLSNYLPDHIMKGLHVYRGKEYSSDITILHMISQTSGLPGYLTDKPASGISGMKELEAGIDRPWPTDKIVERIKGMEPHFPPGEGKKAKYVDTNHQLLNLVIEKVMDKPIQTVLNQLFSDLNMANTYVCEDPNDESYVFTYYKDKQIDISRFITSTHNDVISTAQDQMIFIKAFFNGSFYPKEQLKTLEKWKSIFFPFQYGIGIQRFYIPPYMSPFSVVPAMVGHCGSTGSVAFCIPEMDIFITGTTNQQSSPNISFQTMIKIVNAIK